eukprot:TRINITY_DN3365_c0_g1_i1.p1 TRINITY_DN3365_c0_g1~~TRINITY_DN3365_c0_g1_i1.p1  ORF type:complete len:504 (-),score=105.92 TRINITY_DN3365_c0_g1_i1:997-2469(-)
MARSSKQKSQGLNVVVRVRPPQPQELKGHFEKVVDVSDTKTINLQRISDTGETYGAPHSFQFSSVFDEQVDQAQVYESSVRGTVLSVLEGYNGSVIAYGPTGTGKTFTMEGGDSGDARGVIPRSMEDIFTYIEQQSEERPGAEFSVRASYMQIYNEAISDLLVPKSTNLNLIATSNGLVVEGLSEHNVTTEQHAMALIRRGKRNRFTAATTTNEMSSRSHAIFIVVVEQRETAWVNSVGDIRSVVPTGTTHDYQQIQQNFKVGKLFLVDLAGSENLKFAAANVSRFRECRTINQSLFALSRVVEALAADNDQIVPYRESKLTRVLKDSLGGDCRTTLMAMCSPDQRAFHHTLNTLWFAERAEKIENDASVNEVYVFDQKTLLQEVRRLRAELAALQQYKVELEAIVGKAEAEKSGALQLLEKMSSKIDELNSENDRMADMLEDVTRNTSDLASLGAMTDDEITSTSISSKPEPAPAKKAKKEKKRKCIVM